MDASFLETERIAFILDDESEAAKLNGRIKWLHDKEKLDRQEAVRALDWIEQINRFDLSVLETVHKSQGRSVDTLFIDTKTVWRRPWWMSPEVHKRLLYTAVTRGRKEIVFYSMAGYCETERVEQEEPKLAMAC